MSESREHREMQEVIVALLKKEGYEAEAEHSIGRLKYDVVTWDKESDKKIFIEIYTYPPRFAFKKPNIICGNCKYSWHTKSENKQTCCPNCLYKVKRISTPENFGNLPPMKRLNRIKKPLVQKAVEHWLSD
jgi:hypothetical protein